MPIAILMPALSPTMTEGTLASWHVKEGDTVSSGDIIAEIETDKATMEVEAIDDGTIGRILVAEGTQGVAVNSTIALLLEEGEDADATATAQTPAPISLPDTDSPPPVAPSATPAPAPAPTPTPAAKTGGRIFASPLARRLAREAGIDLSGLSGSGPHGRIVKADVEAARAGGPSTRPAAASAVPDAPAGGTRDVPLTSMRRVIAERMTLSKQTVPHFYLTVDCRIDALLKLRAEANAAMAGESKLSVNDFVIRATALALYQVPNANVAWNGDSIRHFDQADVAVAVATERGLITPIIRAADNKPIAVIAAEARDLAERARASKLMPEEYQGGSFTISNLGMFGIREFAAIINPPQACILAVGAGEARPIVEDGKIVPATVMSCTLAVDHRAVDGALGAEWLAAFKRLIEAPLKLLL